MLIIIALPIKNHIDKPTTNNIVRLAITTIKELPKSGCKKTTYAGSIIKNKEYINRAFYLAYKGIRKAFPNPMVGCVIVKNNIIIGEGYHKKYGMVR